MTPGWRGIGIAVALGCAPASAAQPQPAGVVAAIYDRTNALRADAGRAPVAAAPMLEAAARDLAEYMAATGRYGHEADGRAPAARVKAHGYDACIVSENIAYRYSSSGYTTDVLASAFVQGWRDSPPHRRNLLDPEVTQTGAAVSRGARNGYYYAVQVFGLPASAAMRFTIVNEAPARVGYTIAGKRFELAPRARATHTRCRAAPVTLASPDGARATVEPRDGVQYAIDRDASGAWRIDARP